MAATNAYTLDEAKEMLEKVKDAHKQLITGQAKSYRIGTREFTSLDLNELMGQIEYFSNLVEVLSGQVRKTRVVRVVPRDL